MRSPTVAIVLFSAIYLSAMLYTMAEFVILHETIHQRIFTAFGCDSEVVWEFTSVYTQPVGNCTRNVYMDALHLQNEIESYPDSSILASIWTVGFILSILIILVVVSLKERGENDKAQD